MAPTAITAQQFEELDGLDDWEYEQSTITADFQAGGFTAAAALAARIAAAADEADHHPDIDIRYPDRVCVRFTTHSAGGVTDLDVTLARRVSAIAAEHVNGR